MPINVEFTTPPDAPSSTDAATFRTRSDAFVAYIVALVTKLIAFVTQINSTESNINAKESSAVAASEAAVGAANYQGDWAEGSYSKGQSVSKDGFRYVSKINLNLDTPPSSNWLQIGNATSMQYDNTTSGLAATNVQTAVDEIDARSDSHIPLSGVTAYHLLSGSLALANSVITIGYGTYLYTGNTTTPPSVNLGMDIESQWGNSASETFGYIINFKSRSAIGDWTTVDSIRGTTKYVSSNTTAAEGTDTNMFTLNTVGGETTVTMGSSTRTNSNTVTYVMEVFQLTHRMSGTTNHTKAYTCHYNPFTGVTADKYEGSSIAGHEIPHHLGRKLGFVTQKNLSAVADWLAYVDVIQAHGQINLTTAIVANDTNTPKNGTDVMIPANGVLNTSTNQYILYGWANSYYDETNTLQGNYEIGIYQGSVVAGNKVTTRGKPAWLIRKRIDTTGNWNIQDNLRSLTLRLFANLSNADSVADLTTFVQDGFVCGDGGSDTNASGGQYLYMVVYDNDSGSGKSKYPRATDTSTLNLNAIVPFANGIDASGTRNTELTKNETVSGLTLTQGKNYVYAKNDGTYGVKSHSPKYNTYNGFGEYFDTNKNQWFNSPSVFSDDFSTDTGWLLTGATKTVANSTLTLANSGAASGYASKAFSTVAGTRYKLVGKYSLGSSAGASVLVGTTQNGLEVASQAYTASSDVAITFVATGTTTYVSVKNTGATVGLTSTFNDFAVYPVQGDGSVDTSNSTAITESRNYLDAIVYADQNGQPTYVEQLPKIEYKDIVKANEFQGKNICTAWVNFDGTTTPPSIRDSFNVSAVIRISTGVYEIYFEREMERTDYAIGGTVQVNNIAAGYGGISDNRYFLGYSTRKAVIGTYWSTGAYVNTNVNLQIFGGKN